MANTFGVTHADVGRALPGLFSLGFTDSTKPTRLQVEEWIAVADALVTSKLTRVAGAVPDDDDPGTGMARQYIILWTLAMVARAVYGGNDPLAVAAAANQYAIPAKDVLAELLELGPQATGAGTVFNRVLGVDSSLSRDFLIDDTDLGGLSSATPGVSRRRQF